MESAVDVQFSTLFGGELLWWNNGIVVIVMFWWWIRAIKLNGGSVQEVEIIIICSPRCVRR